jgi:Na+-translocating ferredoxin:NAD+ oxidoreductase RNF subunit RnfB
VRVKRSIVQIDEQTCNGCGVCVTPCAEGAIQIVNGKAKVVKEELCDGAGFCLGVCPTGALTIVERDAEEFSETAAAAEMADREREGARYIAQTCFSCGASEETATLIPCRRQGASVWVCTKCLPALIHG